MNISSKNGYVWTQHALFKMRFWGLSQSRVRRAIKSPLRVEEGIAPDTIAVMQPASYKGVGEARTWTQEIWVMYVLQSAGGKREDSHKKGKEGVRIISAWRYPGKTKPREGLPEEIMLEIREALGSS